MDDINLGIATLFAGERLCLDFVNTEFHNRGVEVELLKSGEALRWWLGLAESIWEKQLSPDAAAWAAGYGERVLPKVIRLRGALRDLVLSVIEKTPVPMAALETVNAVLRENPTYAQMEYGNDAFQESIAVCHPEERWLILVARDALDLLCEGDLSLLRQCDCPTCIRVFYDTTKNHKRRWCVEKCGSKPKAAAYYRRKVAREAQAKSLE